MVNGKCEMVNKKMQLFQDFKSKTGREITPEELHRMITGDEKLKADTLLHRQLLCSGQTDAATRVKEGTPQVAVSFRMEGGKSLADCRECLYLLLIDFDAKGPKEQLSREERERVYTVLRTSYHALIGYESISGMGYHIIVPFRLPEGVTIDMEHDPKRGAEIFLGLVMTKLGYTSIRKGHNGTRGYVLREKSQMDIERMHATTLNADIADMLTSNS